MGGLSWEVEEISDLISKIRFNYKISNSGFDTKLISKFQILDSMLGPYLFQKMKPALIPKVAPTLAN